jgi:catechol 2,3-dioxygenase-like lactoylglutathione lyase family enzyme
MEVLKIKETCIYILDLQAAHDFYSKVLGLEVINYAKDKHLFLRAGSSVLLLFNPEDSKKKKSPPGHYGGGKQHFAFEIETLFYEEAKAELLSKGIQIIDEMIWPAGGKSFYFNDPEGNVLEIVSEKGIWD